MRQLSNRKVVVHRNQLFKPSETFIVQQARNLTRHQIVYAGWNRSGAAAGPYYAVDEVQPGVKALVHKLTGRPAGFGGLKTMGPWHLVHSHFAIDGVYGMRLAEFLAVPLVVTLHGFDVSLSRHEMLKSGNVSWLRYMWDQARLYERASTFVCVSDFVRRKAIAAGFPQSKLLTCYVGVDTEYFSPEAREIDDFSIAHVGRLVEKKGTEDLIRAIAYVQVQLPGVRLTVAGDGPLRGHLERVARECGVSERIQFVGSLEHDDVRDLISRSAIVAAPSRTASNGDAEGLPTVLVEAASMGKALLATRHAGIPELIANDYSGIVVDEGDVEALARKLSMLLSNPELGHKMGIRARENVLTNFNVVRQTAQLESIYDRAVAS